MTTETPARLSVVLVATTVACVVLYHTASVFAPLTLALFLIAVLWPIHSALARRITPLPALAVTILLTIVVLIVFGSLVVWGFSRVGHAMVTDAARYQALYQNLTAWLDGFGISIATLWADNFNVGRVLGLAQRVTSRLNTTLSFWLITLLYVVLILLEIDMLARKMRQYLRPETADNVLAATAESARKLRLYLSVRTKMSAMTGILIGLFAWTFGMQFPMEWAVIGFTLNYIPFIGSFVATLLPTLVEMTQMTAWESILAIFLSLNAIQFIVGSYIEPRLAGTVLSVSPPLVLFATFFGSFMWGLYGAFIGVPIVLVVLTFCAQFPSTRWIAGVFSGDDPAIGPATTQTDRTSMR